MDDLVGKTATSFQLNGETVTSYPETGARLSGMLREEFGARDVKIGCNAGDCGACTVLVDGDPICACLMPAHQAEGRSVETLSGLYKTDTHAKGLAERFQDHGAAQCGICTPGMMVSAVALLRENAEPNVEEVQDALGGVLCRCTGYRKIIDAVIGVPANIKKSDGQVGDTIRKLDGEDKVAGREAFGDDVAPAGTLEIFVIRSPSHRAAFSFGDMNGFLSNADGIEAILTAEDVKGRNVFGVIPQFMDQPVFAETETR
ncbi:MAG: aldehyde oxidoreductase, partial [Paracoccaceae bacterium]